MTARAAAARSTALAPKFEAWRKALRLIINGIAYITAYPEDIETSWPEQTPQSLQKKLREGKPKERRRAKSALAELGFTEIHVGGRRAAHQGPARPSEPTH